MAKRRARLINDNPLSPTAGQADEVEIPAEGRTVPTSVGLKESEVELLNNIAADYGIARNAVMRWALRWFLQEHEAGRISLASDVEEPPPPKRKLNMP